MSTPPPNDGDMSGHHSRPSLSLARRRKMDKPQKSINAYSNTNHQHNKYKTSSSRSSKKKSSISVDQPHPRIRNSHRRNTALRTANLSNYTHKRKSKGDSSSDDSSTTSYSTTSSSSISSTSTSGTTTSYSDTSSSRSSHSSDEKLSEDSTNYAHNRRLPTPKCAESQSPVVVAEIDGENFHQEMEHNYYSLLELCQSMLNENLELKKALNEERKQKMEIERKHEDLKRKYEELIIENKTNQQMMKQENNRRKHVMMRALKVAYYNGDDADDADDAYN